MNAVRIHDLNEEIKMLLQETIGLGFGSFVQGDDLVVGEEQRLERLLELGRLRCFKVHALRLEDMLES